MDFAEIRYIKDKNELWIKPLIMKMPFKLYIKYLMLFAPLKVELINSFEGEGICITFPILKNEDNADLELRLIKKAAAILIDKKIDIVINRENIPFMQGFKEVTGAIAMSFFMKYIINEAAHINNIDLANAEVIIIDGDNIQTYAVFNSIKEDVNNLWIQTSRKEKLKNTLDAIYDYSGLLVECFESVKNPVMGTGDIIINCRGDMENFDYSYKRGACYIDVSGFIGKFKRLLERRKDMVLFNNCSFYINDEITDAFGAEAYFLIKSRKFEDAFENDNKSYDIENISCILTQGHTKFKGLMKTYI